jgi:hypothetical protein
MDQELLDRLKEKGYADFLCLNVVYGESIKEVCSTALVWVTCVKPLGPVSVTRWDPRITTDEATRSAFSVGAVLHQPMWWLLAPPLNLTRSPRAPALTDRVPDRSDPTHPPTHPPTHS